MISQKTDICHSNSESPALRERLLGGFIGTAYVRLIGIVLGLGTTVFLARLMGPSAYGAYAYVMAVVSLLAVLAQFGLPTLVIRETARARQQASWALLRGLWRWSPLVAGILSFLMGLIALAAIALVARYVRAENHTALVIGLILLPLIAWSNLAGAALTGLQRVVLGQLPDNILRPGILLLLLAISLIWLPDGNISAVDALIINIAAAGITVVVGALLIGSVRPVELANWRPVYAHRVWLSSAWPLALMSSLQLFNHQADLLILGVLASTAEVGIYRAVSHITMLVGLSLQIVNMVIAPRITHMHVAGQSERLQRMITRSAQVILLGALPIALVLLVFGEALLMFVFGTDYTSGYFPLTILIVGQMFNAGLGSVALLLNMTGNERATLKGVAIATLCNIPLNLVLIPVLGMVGAALASTTSLVLWNVILWRAARQLLHLDTTAFGLRKPTTAT